MKNMRDLADTLVASLWVYSYATLIRVFVVLRWMEGKGGKTGLSSRGNSGYPPA